MALDEAGGGGAPAAGGAVDLLGTAAAAPGSEGQGGGGDAGAAGGGGGDGAAGGDPEWWSTLSAERDGDAPAHRDVVKAKGWKSLDDVVKGYREAERAMRDSGRVKIPGEGASAEDVSAFHRAIGVPNEPKDYSFTPPKLADGSEVELDAPGLERVAAAAHKLGVPKAALEGVVNEYLAHQVDQLAASEAQLQADADAWVKAQGQQGAAKTAAIDNACRVLADAAGIDRNDLLALRAAWGAEKALNVMAWLGAGIGEDVLVSGTGRQRFAVNGAQAKADLERRMQDKAWGAKAMVKGTAENAEYNRLNDAVAAEAARKAQEFG